MFIRNLWRMIILMPYTRTVILFICLLIVSACAERGILIEPVSPETVLMREAAGYWDREDYPTSQNLYQELSEKPGLTHRQQIIIWQRLGISAYYNQDYETALLALERWADLVPRAEESWQWHEFYSLSLKQVLGEDIYYRYMDDTSQNLLLLFEVRKNAALILVEFYFEEQMYPEAMHTLEKIYAQAETDRRKKDLEQSFQEYLEQLTQNELETALPFMDEDRMNSFPYNVFFWALYTRQLERDPLLWETLRPRLSQLSREGEFLDQRAYLREVEDWLERLGEPVDEIAMLLPLSGQFASSGRKILRGAGIAHQKMLFNGLSFRLRIINTDQDGWIHELESMDSVSIVGGPVSRDVWKEVTASGLNREKIFFTFLPSIDEEGVSGWRFFNSPADQVRALLDRSIENLGFTDFAVFYPEDDFGRTFAQVFYQEAERKGVRVSGFQSYPGDEPERWNSIVASFLNVRTMGSPSKNPSPDFQAVFIPDSLSRVKGIIPQFFYFDQNQLVFMGPMLWSQAYSPDTLEQQYFSLSMTSGAWLDDNPSPGSMELKSSLSETAQGDPDLWAALGYDFVRFAARLGNLPPSREYEQINNQLANISFFDWSMAPIYWDVQGKAFQDLYVLQMDQSNLSLADMDYLSSLVMIREARKAQWIEMIREKEQESRIAD